MIESICNLLSDAGAAKMQLTITTDGNNARVIAMAHLPPASMHDKKNAESQDALKIRAALASPLVIEGQKGEVDVQLTELLEHYAHTFVQGAKAHDNLADVTSKVSSATKATSKNQKSTSKAAGKANATKASTPTETPKNETDSTSNTQAETPSSSNAPTDDFFGGNVDSL
ncbi:MAG: hypothetical protein GJ680_19105 [Alteromonadaceae bacterium]|nr:hypothetical protein [Alteromonadaceae bacterium]